MKTFSIHLHPTYSNMLSEREEKNEAERCLNSLETKYQLEDTFKGKTNSREKWGNGVEFLFSCISLSVGLGNVWRFPFIAYQNGGGAFVIPYLIVLLIIGRPIYYLEIIIGQFSSAGCVKAFNLSPMMRGIAYGQVFITCIAITYYASIMGLTLRFLVASFSSDLPWSYCKEEWGANCLNSSSNSNSVGNQGNITSAELYFIKEILREPENIDKGIGSPNLDLVLCLGVSWLITCIILIKGIKSSGKVSYFLGSFPYLVMCILLVRVITLPGAIDGIIYFFKPQWSNLLNPTVWYAAVTQVFFSLAICFGTLIMYASYNEFSRNVYKDVIIITTMDSLSSMIAGCIIFGILGNLALETNSTDIGGIVKGGAGLAFISYPEAISKFKFCPQIFATLFFSMLMVLGIGSTVGMGSSLITVIKDQFNRLPLWILAIAVCSLGFLIGIVYMTPGGQFILNLVDFYGTSMTALVLAIGELLTVSWIYGTKRFCRDIQFMSGISPGTYWRISWTVFAPALLIFALICTFLEYKPLTYKDVMYPDMAYVLGWTLLSFGIVQVPIWAAYTIFKQPQGSILEKISSALRPDKKWGPLNPETFTEYQKFQENIEFKE